jgi:hypothetical protein
MADNINITAGSGTPVWTDDLSGSVGGHAQYLKLADGTDGGTARIPGDANRGLKVNPGVVARLSATPTIDTSAYAHADAVGGLLTFTNAARFSGGGLVIKKVFLINKDQEPAPFELVLFDRTFTNTADQATFDPTDADLANIVAIIPISEQYYFSDNAVGVSPDLDLPVLLNGTSLFGQLVTRGTPTFTASSDLTVIISAIQE